MALPMKTVSIPFPDPVRITPDAALVAQFSPHAIAVAFVGRRSIALDRHDVRSVDTLNDPAVPQAA